MSLKLKQPSSLYAGIGSISCVDEIFQLEKAKFVVVFSDNGVKGSGLLQKLTKLLDGLDLEYQVIEDLKPEPSYRDVVSVLDSINMPKVDVMIALGGGSVMDTCKLCSVLYDADFDIHELLNNSDVAVKTRKTIMIPTTCGTGAEATPNSIVLVPEDELKIGIVNEAMIPDYVILDADMIRFLPKPILAATAVDALSHVVECYTSKKATILSNTYAAAGAALIFHNIREAYSDPENMKAKMGLLLGAYYGGVAITGSGTTAVHALSYPLGGKYHIPHGVSNAILLAHVMRFNMDVCRIELADLYNHVFPNGKEDNVDSKANQIIKEIEEIVAFTEIPLNLEQYGVHYEDIEKLVEAAGKVTRLLNNNKKMLTREDIRTLYTKVLEV